MLALHRVGSDRYSLFLFRPRTKQIRRTMLISISRRKTTRETFKSTRHFSKCLAQNGAQNIKALPVSPAKAGSRATVKALEPWIPAFAKGCPGKHRGFVPPRNSPPTAIFLNPLPPPAGGRGKGEGAMRQYAALPASPSPGRLRRGPSLSPLKGGEGLFRLTCDCAILRVCNRFRVPGQPCAFAGMTNNLLILRDLFWVSL